MLSESEGMFLAHRLRAAVPDAYAQHVLKGLWSVHALVSSAHTPVPDLYAQRMHQMHQFLMRMLSAHISSLPACQDTATGSFLQLGMKALDF